jgi:hypothetical protein
MTDFDQILDELIVRNGGDEKLGLSGLAVCRSIAALLSSDELDGSAAKTIASLQSLLPPLVVEVAPSSWDFEQLSEADFGHLLSFAARAGAATDGANIAPLPVEEALLRAGEQLAELTSERQRRWDAERMLDEARTELAKHRQALEEVARLLAESEARSGAAAGEDAPVASAEAPEGNLVHFRPRPACEVQECNPSPQSDYSHLDGNGAGLDRFDNRGPT